MAKIAGTKISTRSWWRHSSPPVVHSERKWEVVRGDALTLLSALSDGVADVVFLDPPFNLGKRYGRRSPRGDRLDEHTYEAYMQEVFAESHRVLAPGGSLFLYHIPRWAVRLAGTLADLLTFRHWIAISMKNGFVRGDRLYPAHYALLHYTKGLSQRLMRPKIPPAKCPHCGEFLRDYGGYRHTIVDGVNLSDVWDDISPVRHSRLKHRKANELPVAIPLRALQIAGRHRGLVVDPFAGTGTTAVAAGIVGMKSVLGDRDGDYCRVMVRRLTMVAHSKRVRE